MAGRRFDVGFYKSRAHQEAAQLAQAEFRRYVLTNVHIVVDLEPMARAISDIGLAPKRVDAFLARPITHGIKKFNTWAHRALVRWTGIKFQGRLRRGVSTRAARAPSFTATYVIFDRHIRITKKYFRMSYRARVPGRPGGLARAKKPFSPVGGTHAAWNIQRLAPHTFTIGDKGPLFIHLRKYGHNHGKSGGDALMPVFGPNPAKLLQEHPGEVDAALEVIVETEVMPEVARQYDLAVAEAKRKHGL